MPKAEANSLFRIIIDRAVPEIAPPSKLNRSPLRTMWLQLDEFLDIHERYLETVGRGILLAQSFEQNCKYVLLIWDLGRAVKEGDLTDVEKIPDHAEILLKRFLGTIVTRFGTAYGLKPEQFETLQKARDARNFIAHEAATPCLYSVKSDEAIADTIPLLREHVEALINGDNLVSGWSFMIQEKRFPPAQAAERYAKEMSSWIFEPLTDNGY